MCDKPVLSAYCAIDPGVGNCEHVKSWHAKAAQPIKAFDHCRTLKPVAALMLKTVLADAIAQEVNCTDN
jgi:hypothetical protein